MAVAASMTRRRSVASSFAFTRGFVAAPRFGREEVAAISGCSGGFDPIVSWPVLLAVGGAEESKGDERAPADLCVGRIKAFSGTCLTPWLSKTEKVTSAAKDSTPPKRSAPGPRDSFARTQKEGTPSGRR